MALFDHANRSRFAFEAGGSRPLVAEFSVHEHVSEPFEVKLTLAAEEELEPETLLGKEGLLTVAGEETDRHFHGVVTRIEHTGASGRFYLYRDKSVGVDQAETIGANMSLTVGLNKTETVAINTAETIGVAKALTIGGLYQVSVGGAVNESVAGAKAEEVGLVRALLVGRDLLETVGGDMTVKVAVDLEESVSETHTLNAKEILIDADTEVELKCGNARITLKKGGELRIEGQQITVTGSGNLTLKGSKIYKKPELQEPAADRLSRPRHRLQVRRSL